MIVLLITQGLIDGQENNQKFTLKKFANLDLHVGETPAMQIMRMHNENVYIQERSLFVCLI